MRIEVNSACNLDCPLCFADSGTHLARSGFQLTYDQVNAMLDTFVAAEGDPEVVQFSGGEPTLHPQLLDFIALAQRKGISYVMVNTNGIRIARDDELLAGIARLRPHIYLQFDGFDERTNDLLRGRPDLLETKLRALDRLADADVDLYLDYLKNRTLPRVSDDLLKILERLWSSSAPVGSDRAAADVHRALDVGGGDRSAGADRCTACAARVPLSQHTPRDVARHVFMINTRDFMDPWTFNVKNVMKCCVEFLVPDGRMIPFCAYNSVGYREQVTASLEPRGSRVSPPIKPVRRA